MTARSGVAPGALRALVGAAVVLLTVVVGAPAEARARECATVRLLDAARRGALSSPLAALQMRPPSTGFVDSTRFPLRAHYPDASLAPRAEELLLALEDAWQRQVVERGYPAPLLDDGEGGDDRLDAYLGLTAPAAALTLAHDDVDADDGRHATYAHLVVDPSVDDAALAPLVHHELAHAIQFGIDTAESLMFFEASAVAEEYLLDRSLGFPTLSWAEDLDDFQASPSAAPFTNGIELRGILGEDTYYEYGAALFLLYLDQAHGAGDGALLRDLWLASAQPDEVEDNEPDWLDALEDELPVSLDDVTLDFATWRVLVSSWATPGDGLVGAEHLTGRALLRTRRLVPAAIDGRELALGEAEQPQQRGCFTFETTASDDEVPLVVRAEPHLGNDGAGRPIGLAWLVGDPDADRATRGVHGESGAALTLRLSLRDGETGLFAVCDLGDADADEEPEPRPIRVRVSRADAVAPDAGPVSSDAGIAEDAGLGVAPPVGCGCQGAPSSGAGRRSRPLALVALSLVGMLIFLVRLRRVAKRRRLYRDDAARRRG